MNKFKGYLNENVGSEESISFIETYLEKIAKNSRKMVPSDKKELLKRILNIKSELEEIKYIVKNG